MARTILKNEESRASDIMIRTMASDLKLLERSGGQFLDLDSPELISSAKKSEATMAQMFSKTVSLTPEAKSEVEPQVKSQIKLEARSLEKNQSRKNSKSAPIMIIIILVMGILGALTGYFLIFPWLFEK